MTSPTRLRVVTPERLDALVAALVNTAGSATGTAVATKAGTGTPTTTGVVTATANSLMQRDANARAQIANPTIAAEIANKSYVDTAIGTTVLTSTRGVASGVATLDGSALVPTGQIAPIFPRSLGSGTSLPSTHNTGDFYNHTGIGCLFRWDATSWTQAGNCTVATRAARDSLSSTYSGILPNGFTVLQVDHPFRWRWSPGGWVYAGWGGNSSYGDTINATPKVQYQTLNFPMLSNQNTVPTGWVQNKAYGQLTQQEWLTYSGSGNFTVNDDCSLAIHLYFSSDAGFADRSWVYLNVPGGTASFPGGTIADLRTRSTGYGGAGTLGQSLQWTGAVQAGSTLSTYVNQYNTAGTTINYQCYLSFEMLPG